MRTRGKIKNRINWYVSYRKNSKCLLVYNRQTKQAFKIKTLWSIDKMKDSDALFYLLTYNYDEATQRALFHDVHVKMYNTLLKTIDNYNLVKKR